MFIKNILKAFCPDTEVRYYINDLLISDYHSVETYMESGLTTYDSVEAGNLVIIENAIEIRLYTD